MPSSDALAQTNSQLGTAQTNVEIAVTQAATPEPSVGERLIWYVPNRVLDLFDIFRLRARMGPGLALNARLTDYGAFYFGSYKSVYLGLPGPRERPRLKSPIGIEYLDGIVFAGIDATDDTCYGPRYSPTEIDAGVHLLAVGLEAGFDPVELGDFLGGLFFLDVSRDDFPGESKTFEALSSGLSIGPGHGPLCVEDKPANFPELSDRLDYLHNNVYKRFNNCIRTTDELLADKEEDLLPVAQSDFRLSVFAQLVQSDDFSAEFHPDLDVKVDLPNTEHRLKLFIQSHRSYDLPGRSPAEQESRGISVGLEREMKRLGISLHSGIRTKWIPEVYGRIAWRSAWSLGNWRFLPSERLFWESEDGFGSLTQFPAYRWIGAEKRTVFQSGTSAKITERTEGLEWEQSFAIGRIFELIEETWRGGNVGYGDAVHAYGMRYSIFGLDDEITGHRVALGYRFPLYGKWLFADLRPGVELAPADDYDPVYRFDIGLDMLFWGCSEE